jgi:hypothetical protein
MRRPFVVGITGIVLATLAGCGPNNSTTTPTQMMELPKEGPKPADGKPGKSGSGVPEGTQTSSDQ